LTDFFPGLLKFSDKSHEIDKLLQPLLGGMGEVHPQQCAIYIPGQNVVPG
jgi:hypothetical protein